MGVPEIALGVAAAGKVAGGIGAYQSASAQKQLAQENAYIGRTRAMQTDVEARQGLMRDLGTLRAELAGSGQGFNLGSSVLLDAYRKSAEQQRRMAVGNENMQALSFTQQARSISPGLSLFGGVAQAAQPAYSLFTMMGA